MRRVSGSLEQSLNDGKTTIANCWVIEKRDGSILRITDIDTDITAGGVVFKSAPGVSATNISENVDFAPGNLEIDVLIDDVNITKSDILSGIYDQAKIQMFAIDYSNPPSSITNDNVLWIKTGVIGNVSIKNNLAKVEFRGLEQFLKQEVIHVTSRICRATLGDSKCTKDLTAFTFNAMITGNTGKSVVVNITSQTNMFADGYLELLDGPVPGARMDILSNSGSEIILFDDPFLSNIVGLNAKLVAGCDKSINTCQNKFNNVVFFQGEPHVPTRDNWVAGKKAKPGSVSTTTSGGGK